MNIWLRRVVKAFLLIPVLALCWLYRAGLVQFNTGSLGLAVVPGKLGVWWRRNWYQRTLERCGVRLNMNWMAFIYMPDIRVGNDVYIGPQSSVIAADIGDNVMLATKVSVARGAHQHGFSRLDTPMNRQPGQPQTVKIGDDVWIGTAAVILADVAAGSIVGAGAVVTKPFEPLCILAGVPAKVIRRRGPVSEGTLPADAQA